MSPLVPHTHMQRKRTKEFKEKTQTIDKSKTYSFDEALELLKQASYEKFDPSIEVHVRTGIDPKKGDQVIRGSVVLPNSIGKTKRIAVFAEGDKADEAQKAGADIVGGKELIQEIKTTGKAEFDVAIATPDMMKHLAVVAKILGPKGLMPAPKNETVTQNIKHAVEEVKKGKVMFKNDDTANVHQVIGKRSLENGKLKENYEAFLDALKKAKPSAAKGTYIKTISLSTTMGPGVWVTTA